MSDPPSSSSKDAPKTFAERGVAVPFTTAELLFARVRQKGEGKELLVPGLAQTRGIYVYEWASMRNRFQLSLHDRLLHMQVRVSATPNPGAMSAVALRVARGGTAGGEALAAAEETARQAESLPLLARFTLTQRLLERLGAGAFTLSPEELITPEGQQKMIDALAPVSHVYSMSGPQLAARLETLGNYLGLVGVAGMPVEPPARRLAQRLDLLSKALT
jgi:hypothetical protein